MNMLIRILEVQREKELPGNDFYLPFLCGQDAESLCGKMPRGFLHEKRREKEARSGETLGPNTGIGKKSVLPRCVGNRLYRGVTLSDSSRNSASMQAALWGGRCLRRLVISEYWRSASSPGRG